MNEAQLVKDALRAVEQRLPRGWKARLKAAPVRGGRPDAVLDIVAPDGTKARLVVEAKATLVPRNVAALKAQLASYSSDPGLVVASFLTPSTRERLRDSNMNFVDLTGNVRLSLSRPGLYVETEGAVDDPSPVREPGRSLRGPKAGRLVRALCDFAPPLSISDVAAKAKVDISYASRLVEWLAREALVERRTRGAVLSIDKAALIRRWATNYSVLKSNDATGYLDPRGLENLVQRVAGGALRRKYAVTGSIAANRIAPVAPARLAMLYVDDVSAAAKALNLRPTDAGMNVMLLAPFDSVVFDRTWIADRLTLVAPSQAAVDLLTSPGRGPSEGDAVLESMGLRRPPELSDGPDPASSQYHHRSPMKNVWVRKSESFDEDRVADREFWRAAPPEARIAAVEELRKHWAQLQGVSHEGLRRTVRVLEGPER
jgi:hypothetical protein